MPLGLGVRQGRRRFLIGAFTPAQLPGVSAWYDPSDMSTLFQDVAMTVPVTAAGQSVAVMRDKSPNGRHMMQATVGFQPIYGTDGAYGYLTFDGTDDAMSATAAAIAGTSVFAGVAFIPDAGWAPANRAGIFADATFQVAGIQLGADTGGTNLRSTSNNMGTETVQALTPFSTDPARRSVLGLYTGPSSFYYRPAGVLDISAPAYASSAAQALLLGRGVAAPTFKGRIYGAVYASANRAESQSLTSWLGSKMGLPVSF